LVNLKAIAWLLRDSAFITLNTVDFYFFYNKEPYSHEDKILHIPYFDRDMGEGFSF